MENKRDMSMGWCPVGPRLGEQQCGFRGAAIKLLSPFQPLLLPVYPHGELEGAGVTEGGGEVLLTLQITGNPTVYTPGQEYQAFRGPCRAPMDPLQRRQRGATGWVLGTWRVAQAD
ncbi:unnamed protein product [Tetraodon nigroviridis]|uniref:Chromosome 13 SCAF15000, whole genome shotgun sequence n=1 Tax=Tetraodon nigroviridis TaxID=99883 RepID=Q4RSA8_TETNG|nr:unnamed protein product [Tetraodon nigroviridis]